MTQPIQLTESVFAIEVPLKTVQTTIDPICNILMWWSADGIIDDCQLLAGNWQLICPVKEVTRSQASELVQWFELNGRKGYRDYSFADDLRYPFFDPISSWWSLLKAKGLDPNKNYILIKKIP